MASGKGESQESPRRVRAAFRQRQALKLRPNSRNGNIMASNNLARGRGESDTSARRIAAVERQRQALELRPSSRNSTTMASTNRAKGRGERVATWQVPMLVEVEEKAIRQHAELSMVTRQLPVGEAGSNSVVRSCLSGMGLTPEFAKE